MFTLLSCHLVWTLFFDAAGFFIRLSAVVSIPDEHSPRQSLCAGPAPPPLPDIYVRSRYSHAEVDISFLVIYGAPRMMTLIEFKDIVSQSYCECVSYSALHSFWSG